MRDALKKGEGGLSRACTTPWKLSQGPQRKNTGPLPKELTNSKQTDKKPSLRVEAEGALQEGKAAPLPEPHGADRSAND